MKALTIWQPWASLIMAGFKPFEFRGWAAPSSVVGQRIVIHAGARPVRAKEVAQLIEDILAGRHIALKPGCLQLLEALVGKPDRLPLSAGLGTALLGTPKLASTIWPEEFVGDSDRIQHSNWAWPLSEVDHFTPIVPARGAQGFWNWPWSGGPQ